MTQLQYLLFFVLIFIVSTASFLYQLEAIETMVNANDFDWWVSWKILMTGIVVGVSMVGISWNGIDYMGTNVDD